MFLRGRTMFAPTSKNPSTANIQNKRFLPHPLFLLQNQAQKKKISKRKRRKKISRSAERDKGSAPLMAPPFKKKAGENFDGGEIQFGKNKSVAFAKKATLSFYCFCSSAYFFGLSPVSFLKTRQK